MTSEEDTTRANIERACAQLSINYGRFVDFKDFDSFCALFMPTATLNLGGREMVGLDAIRKMISKLPDEVRTRHVLTNIHTEVLDDDRATGVSYLTLYQHAGIEATQAGPIEFRQPVAVGEYVDEFVRADAGWRFASRRLDLAFRNSELFG